MLLRPAYLRCFQGGSKQGKEVPEKGIDFGNYNVVSLEDGGALASMNFKVCLKSGTPFYGRVHPLSP